MTSKRTVILQFLMVRCPSVLSKYIRREEFSLRHYLKEAVLRLAWWCKGKTP